MQSPTGTSQSSGNSRTDVRSSTTAVTVVAVSEAIERGLAVFTVRERRGAGPPLHRHSKEDEVVIVVGGRATFFVAGERIDGREGTCVVLPRGIEHGYVIDSDAARLLVVLAPATQGIDECMAEMSDYTNKPPVELESETETGIERLVATAARFGIEITGARPGGSER